MDHTKNQLVVSHSRVTRAEHASERIAATSPRSRRPGSTKRGLAVGVGLLLVLGALTTSGCATKRQVLAAIPAQAAAPLGCPADQITVSRLPESNRYQVAGCGRTVVLPCYVVGAGVRCARWPLAWSPGAPQPQDPRARY